MIEKEANEYVGEIILKRKNLRDELKVCEQDMNAFVDIFRYLAMALEKRHVCCKLDTGKIKCYTLRTSGLVPNNGFDFPKEGTVLSVFDRYHSLKKECEQAEREASKYE